MATRREREVIDRADKIIRLCGSWPGLWQTPDSDTQPYAPTALQRVSDALASLRHEDWDDAEFSLRAAEELVDRYIATGPLTLQRQRDPEHAAG